jgi:hypothetical protein
MDQQWFLDQWAAYDNPHNAYIVEELSTSGMLTVRVARAASAAEVWAQYKSTHYLSTAAVDRNSIVDIPKLKLLAAA